MNAHTAEIHKKVTCAMAIIPFTRTCSYCSEEGKIHPLERFTRLPCCGYHICIDCRAKTKSHCGECFSKLPTGSERALFEYVPLLKNPQFKFDDTAWAEHIIGRIWMNGSGTFVDEIECMPIYAPIVERPMILAAMDPSHAGMAARWLTKSAAKGYIPAMLNLADAYTIDFPMDNTLKPDKAKAEMWFQRALGENDRVSPIAFTRYGLFLDKEGRHSKARQVFEVAAHLGHAKGQHEYAKYLLEGKGRPLISYLYQNDYATQAIKCLCKNSKEGHAPSMVLLAKTLMDFGEKASTTIDEVGCSPLPRALMMLRLAEKNATNDTKAVEEIQSILLSFQKRRQKKQCANCGKKQQSKQNPILDCSQCKAVSYCDQACQTMHYRDGHRRDCVSEDRLFEFDLMRGIFPTAINAHEGLLYLAENPKLVFFIVVPLILFSGFKVGRWSIYIY